MKHITQSERELLSRWKQEGLSNSDCAKRLGRHVSTIGRELTRNSRTRVSLGKRGWKVLVTAREHLKPNQEQTLAKYLSWYPAVSTFYACKESLRDMYKSPTKKLARARLERLIIQMKHSDYPELWLWARTLTINKEYILNYFDNHTTNATIEGLHRKFKLIQRTAYGFSNPEVYIRRIMLACLPLTLLTIHPHN